MAATKHTIEVVRFFAESFMPGQAIKARDCWMKLQAVCQAGGACFLQDSFVVSIVACAQLGSRQGGSLRLPVVLYLLGIPQCRSQAGLA